MKNIVVEARSLVKRYEQKNVVNGIHFTIQKGECFGFLGPNGAGKSAFFRMINGQDKDYSGQINFGQTVVLGYVDQSRDHLSDDKSVWEEISGGNEEIELGKQMVKSRAYCASFNFKGPTQQKLVSQLSGGERNRLHLALTLKKEANVLLLDEPTNDLDVNTLRALEEGLESYAGCAVIISHDRWFLDRVCTHILAFEGDSTVYYFEGGYSEYEENKKKRLGNVEPKRVRYKKLTV